MAKNNNLKDYLIDLYQGIASRKPNASKNPQDFRSEIENLVFTSDANAAASDIRAGKTAYVNDVKVTGTIEDYDESTEENILTNSNLDITKSGTYGIANYTTVTVNIPDTFYGRLTNTLNTYKTDQSVDIGDYTFYNSTIRTFDAPVNSISYEAFRNSKLCNLVLRNNTMTTITESPVLPVDFQKRGCLFVPDDLVDSYKSLDSWKYYKDRIFPLSIYDGGIASYTGFETIDPTDLTFYYENYGVFEFKFEPNYNLAMFKIKIHIPEKSNHKFTINMKLSTASQNITGFISKLDTVMKIQPGLNYYSGYQHDFNNTTEEQSVTFTDVPSGDHFITCAVYDKYHEMTNPVSVYFKAL